MHFGDCSVQRDWHLVMVDGYEWPLAKLMMLPFSCMHLRGREGDCHHSEKDETCMNCPIFNINLNGHSGG